MITGFIIFLLRTVYPLYASVKKFNDNDEDEFPTMIKYWSLFMLSWGFEFILSYIIYGSLLVYFKLGLAVVLVIRNFYYAEVIYDNSIMRLLEENEADLDKIVETIEGTAYGYYDRVRDKINEEVLDKIVPSIKNIFFGSILANKETSGSAGQGTNTQRLRAKKRLRERQRAKSKEE